MAFSTTAHGQATIWSGPVAPVSLVHMAQAILRPKSISGARAGQCSANT